MKHLILFLLMCCASQACAGIRFNEVMQSNINGIMDDLNDFPDSWVELYNEGSSAIDLSGYSIAKKKKYAKAYRLPSVVLQPYAYLVVYCDKETVGLHTDFRLTVDESSNLFLFGPDAAIVDSVEIPPMEAPNIPYCRMVSGEWGYCKSATPAAPNKCDRIDSVACQPVFSVVGGVKSDVFSLTLSLPKGAPIGSFICFTTNGSEPTTQSPLYNEPIQICRTTVVRAKVFAPGVGDSPTATHSYLFLNRQQTLPIVSLVTDSAYFYDDEIGIYTKGIYGKIHQNTTPEVTVFGRSNYYYGWSRPVNVEYFPLERDVAAINQMAETKITGKAGRRQPAKSLMLKAGKRFGNSRFNYPFFDDKPLLHSNKSVVLRNSGQDEPYTYFRDVFAQLSFARHTAVDYHSCQTVLLFVNGVYMGLRNLRERSTDDYLKENYPDLDGFDLIEGFGGTVKCGDSIAFCEFKKLYNDSASTYEQLDSLMDINEFLDYFILYSLYCNTDFPGNNMLMWKTPQTKWRWLAKDFDAAMGIVKSPYSLNYLNYVLREPPFLDRGVFNSEQNCALFKKMMSFPRFRQSFIDRSAIYMGTFASVGSLNALIDSLAANIEYEMPFFAESRKKDELDWLCSLAILKKWVNNRIPYFYSDISRFFDMGAAVPMSVSLSEKVYFNNMLLADGCFDGRYYEGRRIHLSSDSISSFKSEEFHSRSVKSERVAVSVDRIDECWKESDFSLQERDNVEWTVQYVRNDSLYTELYASKDLDWFIPNGVTCVQIQKKELDPTKVIDASMLTFKACDFSGRIIAEGKYSEVMPLLQSGKTYILSSYNGNRKIRDWKVRRLEGK